VKVGYGEIDQSDVTVSNVLLSTPLVQRKVTDCAWNEVPFTGYNKDGLLGATLYVVRLVVLYPHIVYSTSSHALAERVYESGRTYV
jgi:hypothetical protein